jgi:hypothetical protein
MPLKIFKMFAKSAPVKANQRAVAGFSAVNSTDGNLLKMDVVSCKESPASAGNGPLVARSTAGVLHRRPAGVVLSAKRAQAGTPDHGSGAGFVQAKQNRTFSAGQKAPSRQ